MSMGVTLKDNQRILSITNLTQSENVFRRCVAVIPYFLCKSFNVNSHISAFKVVTNSQSNYGVLNVEKILVSYFYLSVILGQA